jgi:hypothetical protein
MRVFPIVVLAAGACSQVAGGPDAGPTTGAAVAIETSAPASLFAGTTMEVACALLDAKGQPLAWPVGAAATIVVGDGTVLALVGGSTYKGHKAGSTTVACRYGSLVDASPVTTLVLPGSPAVVTTSVASASVVAGAAVPVTCQATDGEGNDASGVELPTLGLGNPDAGSVSEGSVTFTKAGSQTVSCAFGTLKGNAAAVTVSAAKPASLALALAPVGASYRPGSTVTATAAVLDAYGNPADRAHLVVTSDPPASRSPGSLQFVYDQVGTYVVTASIDGAFAAGGTALSRQVTLIVNDGGPGIRCDTPSQVLVAELPATVAAAGHVSDPSGLASVTVDGQAVPVSGGAVDFAIDLAPVDFGVNVYQVVATDVEGAATTRYCSFVAATKFLKKGDPELAASPGVGLALGPDALDDHDHTESLIDSLGDVLAKVSVATMRTILDDYLTANPFVAHACVSVICDDAYYVPDTLALGTVALRLDLVQTGLKVSLDATDFSARITTQLLGSSTISVDTLSASAEFVMGAASGVFSATLVDSSIMATYSDPKFDNLLFEIGAAVFPSLVESVVSQVLHNLIGPVVNVILEQITVDRLGFGVTLRRLGSNTDQTTTLGGAIVQASADATRLLGAIAPTFSTTGGTPLPYQDLSLGAAVPGGSVRVLEPPLGGKDIAASIHAFTVNQILHELWENSFFEIEALDPDALAFYGITLDGLDQLLDQFTIGLSAPVPAVAEVRPGNIIRIGAAGLRISLKSAIFDVPLELEVSGVFDVEADIQDGRLHVVSVTPVGPLPGGDIAISVIARPSTLSDAIVDALVAVATKLIHTLSTEVFAQTLVGIPVPTINLPAQLGVIALPGPVTLKLVEPTVLTSGDYLVLQGGILQQP